MVVLLHQTKDILTSLNYMLLDKKLDLEKGATKAQVEGNQWKDIS